jgi:ABC-2 type transport system ATP-binding protein
MRPVAIHCRGLVKRYPKRDKGRFGWRRSSAAMLTAVDGLDLEVAQGECFGLLGPNGAGKTTTVEILEGLLEPDAGAVRVLGESWSEKPRRLRERIGVQLQETQFPEKLTVLEVLTLFRSFYARGCAPREALGLVQLEEKRDSWVRNLSGGQRQRLSLACALVGEPEILFLDEPTTGLDPQSRLQIWGMIGRFRSAGRTVLLTTHYMEEAERLCDRVAIIDHGKVIALGTPAALIASLGAEHVVEFQVDGEVDAETLAALAGVREVGQENGATRLTVGEVHRTIPALLAELSRRQLTLSRLTTHHATLEDVFVALTGRHLREQ